MSSNLLFHETTVIVLSIILWCFSNIPTTGSKIIDISVKSVVKTAGVSKLFLAIFERTYNGLYICYFWWLQHASIKSNERGCSFALPYLKIALKSPWNCMKALISQVLLQTSLLIVQFSKTYLKTISWTFLWTDAFVVFVQSLSSYPSTSFQLFHQLQ